MKTIVTIRDMRLVLDEMYTGSTSGSMGLKMCSYWPLDRGIIIYNNWPQRHDIDMTDMQQWIDVIGIDYTSLKDITVTGVLDNLELMHGYRMPAKCRSIIETRDGVVRNNQIRVGDKVKLKRVLDADVNLKTSERQP